MVGRSVCATCHEDQAALWSGSHRDLAMQPADSNTVPGDFNNVDVTRFGVTSTLAGLGEIRNPQNALAAFHRDSGNAEAARRYGEKLRGLLP